jgi:hypothetical protein
VQFIFNCGGDDKKLSHRLVNCSSGFSYLGSPIWKTNVLLRLAPSFHYQHQIIFKSATDLSKATRSLQHFWNRQGDLLFEYELRLSLELAAVNSRFARPARLIFSLKSQRLRTIERRSTFLTQYYGSSCHPRVWQN